MKITDKLELVIGGQQRYMAVSFCYSVDDVIAAISNADSYRNKAADTGHYVFIDTLLDAEIALQKSGLTTDQQEVLHYRWTLGLTQEETAKLMSRSRESVGMAEVRSRHKIQALLAKWEAEEDV